MKNILKIEKLEKIYGLRGNVYKALDGVSFDVYEGEFLGIMGPSGAGKSTLLNIISTIDKPTSGSVVINGQNIVNMKKNELSKFRRDKLGFVFQEYNLLDTLTVKENIALPLSLANVSYREINRRVKEVANNLEIVDILDKFPYEISGGQRQRAAAARAIIADPALILADEPTGALDSRSSETLLSTLKNINENMNVTVLMVTHDPFAASYCKRILFIKDGRIFNEIVKGEDERKNFFTRILDVLAVLEGDIGNVI
ncbi:MAG TPA: ABC transporter ATP-binding protein [Petrotogaceae bacterium]|nr:ABC transporter ATP-binding protein [Petrotogaceae bacterium]HQF32631.1 ABC transporter ATP-binding protein [Petrotogaceae bacterium]HQH32801.1 ABC transporter ATP-binding protein [Petrotogaceae bacterium]HQI78203.1 ABC transporter ATP-binding protein [Petrotogaceae bacterium]